MSELFQNFIGGTLDADLLTAGTSMSSPGLATMIAVASPDTMRVVLDPEGTAGDPEVVIVTAHTGAATTATITRGAENTVARDHLTGVAWRHAYTAGAMDLVHHAELDDVAATGSTETLAFATTPVGRVHTVTMDQNCTFSFSGAVSGVPCSMSVLLDGAFLPTWPAAVLWPDGTEPAYDTPTWYEFVTLDGGTTVYGFVAGSGFA